MALAGQGRRYIALTNPIGQRIMKIRLSVPRRAIITIGAAIAATAGLTLGLAPAAQADSVGKYISLSGNVTFTESQPHTWSSTTVHLNWQTDGNLVLYCNNSGKALFQSDTYGNTDKEVLTFSNGEIAVIGQGPVGIGDYYAWHKWGSNSNAYAYVQNDGNFVIYNSGGGVAWASGTNNKC